MAQYLMIRTALFLAIVTVSTSVLAIPYLTLQ
jgi:hypothetical protein